MTTTIEVPLTDQQCPLGADYARRHLTSPPKSAVVCCEGACLRGEIARRAANIIARELAPQRAVRICHGGLLEAAGGMKDLVRHADKVLLLDGCPMGCGARLFQGAMPDVKPIVIYTDGLIDFDRSKFSHEDMLEEDITRHARDVARQVVSKYLS